MLHHNHLQNYLLKCSYGFAAYSQLLLNQYLYITAIKKDSLCKKAEVQWRQERKKTDQGHYKEKETESRRAK